MDAAEGGALPLGPRLRRYDLRRNAARTDPFRQTGFIQKIAETRFVRFASKRIDKMVLQAPVPCKLNLALPEIPGLKRSMQDWFEVNKHGLAKILERRGKEFTLFELIQNAWDEPGVAKVRVSLEYRGSTGPQSLCAGRD